MALVYSSFALYYYDGLGKHIKHWWEFGLVAAVIVFACLIASLFVSAVRRTPINWALYGIFTICFAHMCAFLTVWDTSRHFYYALWLITAISIGLALYAYLSNYYMETLISMLVVCASAGLVLLGFIAFSDHKVVWLIIIFLPVAVFGVYMAFDVRTSVRNAIFDHNDEDPVSGAVRIWVESLLVFCRFGELSGTMFHKKTNYR